MKKLIGIALFGILAVSSVGQVGAMDEEEQGTIYNTVKENPWLALTIVALTAGGVAVAGQEIIASWWNWGKRQLGYGEKKYSILKYSISEKKIEVITIADEMDAQKMTFTITDNDRKAKGSTLEVFVNFLRETGLSQFYAQKIKDVKSVDSLNEILNVKNELDVIYKRFESSENVKSIKITYFAPSSLLKTNEQKQEFKDYMIEKRIFSQKKLNEYDWLQESEKKESLDIIEFIGEEIEEVEGVALMEIETTEEGNDIFTASFTMQNSDVNSKGRAKQKSLDIDISKKELVKFKNLFKDKKLISAEKYEKIQNELPPALINLAKNLIKNKKMSQQIVLNFSAESVITRTRIYEFTKKLYRDDTEDNVIHYGVRYSSDDEYGEGVKAVFVVHSVPKDKWKTAERNIKTYVRTDRKLQHGIAQILKSYFEEDNYKTLYLNYVLVQESDNDDAQDIKSIILKQYKNFPNIIKNKKLKAEFTEVIKGDSLKQMPIIIGVGNLGSQVVMSMMLKDDISAETTVLWDAGEQITPFINHKFNTDKLYVVRNSLPSESYETLIESKYGSNNLTKYHSIYMMKKDKNEIKKLLDKSFSDMYYLSLFNILKIIDDLPGDIIRYNAAIDYINFKLSIEIEDKLEHFKIRPVSIKTVNSSRQDEGGKVLFKKDDILLKENDKGVEGKLRTENPLQK